MGFFCYILGTLKKFMAMTAILSGWLFLGFESLPWYWELFHQLKLLWFSSKVVRLLSLFRFSAAICMVTLMGFYFYFYFVVLLNSSTPYLSWFVTLLAFLSIQILHYYRVFGYILYGVSHFG